MIWRLLPAPACRPKFFVNAMPKSGLHVLATMVHAVCDEQPADLFVDSNWVGDTNAMGFATYRKEVRKVTPRLADLDYGRYLKGHCTYRPEIAKFMELAAIPHIFIVRDLRDVAVSQAYHVLSENDERFKHLAKGVYRLIELEHGFDGVLGAVIEGIGPLGGIVERWEQFAPWLEDPNTLVVRFEDVMEDHEREARRVLEFGMNRLVARIPFEHRIEGSIFEKMVKDMADLCRNKELSPTYRKGEPGAWREAFNATHRALFRHRDANDWLVRLGYEESEDWA